jgi:hypothetical protein
MAEYGAFKVIDSIIETKPSPYCMFSDKEIGILVLVLKVGTVIA